MVCLQLPSDFSNFIKFLKRQLIFLLAVGKETKKKIIIYEYFVTCTTNKIGHSTITFAMSLSFVVFISFILLLLEAIETECTTYSTQTEQITIQFCTRKLRGLFVCVYVCVAFCVADGIQHIGLDFR